MSRFTPSNRLPAPIDKTFSFKTVPVRAFATLSLSARGELLIKHVAGLVCRRLGVLTAWHVKCARLQDYRSRPSGHDSVICPNRAIKQYIRPRPATRLLCAPRPRPRPRRCIDNGF